MIRLNLIVRITIIIIILILINSNNPIKTRFIILSSSALIFLLVKTKTGQTWIPLIFFILFIGGILIVFIILSSILPNEKSIKIKIPKTFFLILITSIILEPIIITEKTNLSPEIKRFISTGYTLALIIRVILIYFFGSISINKNEDQSIRSIICWKKVIL